MSVEVRLPTLLRPQAGGAAVLTVEGSTVGKVFSGLVDRYPGLAGSLVDDDGQLHRFVNVYRNDDDIRYLDQLDTTVADGDVISILPAVAGG
ncbi:MAG TPA: ubiquitin-like small modifier protein 1 [Acidimicrobiia bacterium]|jgi:molybdopterin converting factor small subunit|nr:ubiquitin-like small modifier protein 1 [Acidimicrobiia bacterium]